MSLALNNDSHFFEQQNFLFEKLSHDHHHVNFMFHESTVAKMLQEQEIQKMYIRRENYYYLML